MNVSHFASVAREFPDDNVALYVGLGIAVAAFITVIFIIVFLLRRKKGQTPGVYDCPYTGVLHGLCNTYVM